MQEYFKTNTKQPILFFDGICNLCNHTVQFVIHHEQDEILRFSSLQSNLGQVVVAKLSRDQQGEIDSIVLWQDDQLFTKSTAALLIAKRLELPWRLLSVFQFLPRWSRDPIYDLVARYRYTIFGQQDQCMIPKKSQSHRFI